MNASDGEILILRPEGFTVDVAAVQAFLESLPGTFRRSDEAPWALVAPAVDLARAVAEPATATRPGQASFAMVWVRPDEVKVHPGMTVATWGRAQRVVEWLLGLGSWRVTGQVDGRDRELGVVRSLDALFRIRHVDPDAAADPTASPPHTGELTTLRRYLGDVDTRDYFHEFVRVHDSGAFSYEQRTDEDRRRWEGRLGPALVLRWRALVDGLDFGQSSPGYEDTYRDRVAVIVERPGGARQKDLDAEQPPESFAELVRLMRGWAETLHHGGAPADLVDVRLID